MESCHGTIAPGQAQTLNPAHLDKGVRGFRRQASALQPRADAQQQQRAGREPRREPDQAGPVIAGIQNRRQAVVRAGGLIEDGRLQSCRIIARLASAQPGTARQPGLQSHKACRGTACNQFHCWAPRARITGTPWGSA